MLWRAQRGEVPAKHHIAFRGADERLRFEECITREGFDGAYSIAYHLERPHEQVPADVAPGFAAPQAATPDAALLKRHVRSQDLAPAGGPPVRATRLLMFNDDLELGLCTPDEDDPVYRVDADHDTLLFIFEGGGEVDTPLGTLRFATDDYVCVPKGLIHRFRPTPGQSQRWLHLGVRGLRLLDQWRNATGQLTMDAPYCHRDFRLPELAPPATDWAEGEPRELLVRRGGRWHGFSLRHPPCDVVGWDGAVYPWAFHILDFQPRAGLVHLPPTWHGTFACHGGLVCSFVPRQVDFHPEAIPCPYPHASVDVDEILFYVRGNFTSRRGVGPGSLSLHPRGIPHGPHPGAYEKSIGHRRTDELAVMLDVTSTVHLTAEAASVEDDGYMQSFLGD